MNVFHFFFRPLPWLGLLDVGSGERPSCLISAPEEECRFPLWSWVLSLIIFVKWRVFSENSYQVC